VNTASAITRGFINVMKSGSRAAKLEREANWRRDKGNAAVFMVASSIRVFVRNRSCSFTIATRWSTKLRVNAAKSRQIFQNEQENNKHSAWQVTRRFKRQRGHSRQNLLLAQRSTASAGAPTDAAPGEDGTPRYFVSGKA
jgi:hypothetical protein